MTITSRTRLRDLIGTSDEELVPDLQVLDLVGTEETSPTLTQVQGIRDVEDISDAELLYMLEHEGVS